MSNFLESQQILSTIAELTASQGYPPTYRELGRRVQRSSSTIFQRITQLRRQGLIALMEGKGTTRGLRLTEAGWQEIGQPAIRLSHLSNVRHLPVFHSSEQVNRYLTEPMHRENVNAASALASAEVRIIPIAALRSTEDPRHPLPTKVPSFQFSRKGVSH